MKPFALEPNMLTLRGVFYPTGYMFVMYATEKEAQDAERLLLHSGVHGDAISLLTPKEIHDKIAATAIRETALPSPGTEAETVRHFEELARQGHHALFIHAPTARETDHVMEVLRATNISCGQKYRHLVIEDLIEEH